jgi:hypothetical protein
MSIFVRLCASCARKKSAERKAITDAENGIDLPEGRLILSDVADRFLRPSRPSYSR